MAGSSTDTGTSDSDTSDDSDEELMFDDFGEMIIGSYKPLVESIRTMKLDQLVS